MRGGFWPVLNRIMTACIWVGKELSLLSINNYQLLSDGHSDILGRSGCKDCSISYNWAQVCKYGEYPSTLCQCRHLQFGQLFYLPDPDLAHATCPAGEASDATESQ
jgi:hypothetical protein